MRTSCYSFIILVVFLIVPKQYINAQILNDYVKKKKVESVQLQKIEEYDYNNACEVSTARAFNEYLASHPHGKHATEIRRKLEDQNLWDNAISRNTIESYTSYIENSKTKSYVSEAELRISDLKIESEWNQICYTYNKIEYQTFIQKYPNSRFAETAKQKIDELQGIEYYNKANYTKAKYYFDLAGGRGNLGPQSQTFYDVCDEYVSYNELTETESVLISFLNKYPKSKYRIDVENRLAIVKSSRFTMNTSDYEYDIVKSYAHNSQTVKQVEERINLNKKRQDSYNKERQRIERSDRKKMEKKMRTSLRNYRIHKFGKLIHFGLEPSDCGFNLNGIDGDLLVLYYNVGMSLKLGNYNSRTQVEFGVKPGVVSYEGTDYYYNHYYNYSILDEEEYSDVFWHLPLFSKLKVNLASRNKYYQPYLASLLFYDMFSIREPSVESKFQIGGGFGFGYENWDWMVYYKQDVRKDNVLIQVNPYLGLSLFYYF